MSRMPITGIHFIIASAKMNAAIFPPHPEAVPGEAGAAVVRGDAATGLENAGAVGGA